MDEVINQGRRNGMKANHGGRCRKGRWGLNHRCTECRLRGLGFIHLATGGTRGLDQSGKPDDILRRAPLVAMRTMGHEGGWGKIQGERERGRA